MKKRKLTITATLTATLTIILMSLSIQSSSAQHTDIRLEEAKGRVFVYSEAAADLGMECIKKTDEVEWGNYDDNGNLIGVNFADVWTNTCDDVGIWFWFMDEGQGGSVWYTALVPMEDQDLRYFSGRVRIYACAVHGDAWNDVRLVFEESWIQENQPDPNAWYTQNKTRAADSYRCKISGDQADFYNE